MRNSRAVRAAVLAGLAGAALIDVYLMVADRLLNPKASPLGLMQWDASNVLGPASYGEGWVGAAVGTVLHFSVSIVWAALFVAAATRVDWLVRRPLLSGTLLGLVAMSVMRVVIHFGHAVVPPFRDVVHFGNVLVAHVVFFGIPVALVAARLLRQRRLRAA